MLFFPKHFFRYLTAVTSIQVKIIIVYIFPSIEVINCKIKSLKLFFVLTRSTDLLFTSVCWLLLFSFSVVEFKDEEFVKKAIEVMSKHDLNGRPLNIKEVNARSACSVQCVCPDGVWHVSISGSGRWARAARPAEIGPHVRRRPRAGHRSDWDERPSLHRQQPQHPSRDHQRAAGRTAGNHRVRR